MASQDEVKEVFGYFEQKGDALCYRYQAERLFIEPWGGKQPPGKVYEVGGNGQRRLGITASR